MTFHREIMKIYFGTTYFTLICHFGNEKGTGAIICPTIVCSIVAGNAPVFVKVNLVRISS